MKHFMILLSILVTSATLRAQATAPSADRDTRQELSHAAEEKLAASIAELNDLRSQIAAEKIPMAQELTTLEERLTQLRRDLQQVTRLVDEGNLGIAAVKAETKARQDELAYITNLLDEYARSFESKVNISELQHLGESLEAAKQATENTTLTMPEKFDRQVAFVNRSVTRLFDAIGGMRFDGVGVDPLGTVAEGQFAIIGPVALFHAVNGSVAGLVVPQAGSAKPLIRPLEGPTQAGLTTLVKSGEGFMPLDPSRGGALQALIQKASLKHIFEKGGPIMWPLLASSIIALGAVLERLLFLMRERWRRDPKALDRFFVAVTRGDLAGAIAVGRTTKFFVVRALAYALSHKEQSLASALLYAQAKELKRFQRGGSILDTVITLAPLLGLLGTVTGMMGSFKIIGGDLGSPSAITGGIAEALIATAFGLGIAITALLPFNFLNARVEEARHEIESAATQLELLVQPRTGASVTAGSRLHNFTSTAAPPTQPDNDRNRAEAQRRMADVQSAPGEPALALSGASAGPGGQE
jgi:biopolymer transport protein ExbB